MPLWGARCGKPARRVLRGEDGARSNRPRPSSTHQLAIGFRKAHPSLGRSRFWRDDVRWYGVGPQPDLSPSSRSLAFYLRGVSEGDQDLYVMVNAHWAPLVFTIQEGPAARWAVVIDTSRDPPDDFCEPGGEVPVVSPTYRVEPRSVVVLLAR